MLDVTIDQLRALVAVADHRGFSAAARHMHRVQSSVSALVANAEEQLGARVFDRRHRPPTITAEGTALLRHAREVLAGIDALDSRAQALQAGLEAEVSIVFDGLFPTESITTLALAFRERYRDVDLRLGVETLASVPEAVQEGRYMLGVVGPDVVLGPELQARHVGVLELVTAVSADHALARCERPVPRADARAEVQVVLASRADSPDVAVLADRTWRVTDLHVKHALIRAGLGWGNLPRALVQSDLDSGQLVSVDIAGWRPGGLSLDLAAVHRRDRALGEAARWIMVQLPGLCAG